MVKKKLLSLSLVAVMTISSIAPAFAEEIEENIFVDNGAEIVIETGESQVIPMVNERYRYKRFTTYSSWSSCKVSISSSNAKQYSKTRKIPGFVISKIAEQVDSSLAAYVKKALDDNTGLLFTKAGTYTIKSRIMYTKRKNIFSGATYIESRTLQIELYLGGKKIQTKSFPLK